jgi:Uma2 family endonuclease
MPSPVRHVQHGHQHHHLGGWLYLYEVATPGVEGSNNATARLDLENEPQPDLMLFILPACGGRVRLIDGYVEHSPELVAEISASSVALDLGERLRAYQQNGVREYIVWRVVDQAIDWFVLRDGRYEPLTADAERVFRSEVFPGLWLDSAAMLRGDAAAVIARLQRGTATAEHTAFVNRLAATR